MTDILTSTASDICNDAASIAGVIDPSEELGTTELTKCVRAANLLLKSWQTQGHLWKLSDVTVTLTPGTESYSVGPGGAGTLSRVRPLRLVHCVRRTNSIDIEVPIISRQEYRDLPNKSNQGSPINVYYDPQLTNGVLYVWYTGDTSNDTIICTFEDPLDLLDNNTDTPDIPDEWIEPFTYNLAVRICGIYNAPVPQAVAAIAVESLNRMMNFDSDIASIKFMPERYK